ncbi:Mu-like prophage major head subunit gpT family protein [Fundidesulfovibrio butyratiphilus]
MAIVTSALVSALFTGFRREYQTAFGATPSDWKKVATLIPSTTRETVFGWLGQFPQFREWVGERVVRDMKAHGYSISNKTYESTVGLRRTDIEDDQVGIYKPLFEEMGRAAKVFPDEQVFGLMAQGGALSCYDGQPFFDVDHPVYPNVDGTGEPVAVANYAAGTEPAWYLLDDSRALKPFIFQERTKPELTTRTNLDDETVFTKDEYQFGIRYRCNAGFGFWQMAFCSRLPLNSENFNAAYGAMATYKADGGRPLGIRPTLLVVPPVLRVKAFEVALSERLANGADNPNKGLCEVLVTPWLS